MSASVEHIIPSFDGLKLLCREYGQDHEQTVLCLPGLTRNSLDFVDLATHLAPRFRVLSPDLRGRGRSAWDPEPRNYRPGTYVRDAWHLLDAFGVERCAIVGTSLGGLMAMTMGANHPERVDRIVFNDIGPEHHPAGVERIMGYVGKSRIVDTWEEAVQAIRGIFEHALPDMDDDFWMDFARRSYMQHPSGKIGPAVDPQVSVNLLDPPLAYRAALRLNRWGLIKTIRGAYLDPWDAFRTLHMPTLVIHGEHSDLLTPAIIEKMRAVKPDLESVTVPHRGHTPLLNEPEALGAIEAFLGV